MASSTFKVGDKVYVARDNRESFFVRTGARGVVVRLQKAGGELHALLRVGRDDLFHPAKWAGPLAVMVPVDALEKVDGLLDI